MKKFLLIFAFTPLVACIFTYALGYGEGKKIGESTQSEKIFFQALDAHELCYAKHHAFIPRINVCDAEDCIRLSLSCSGDFAP